MQREMELCMPKGCEGGGRPFKATLAGYLGGLVTYMDR